MQQDTDSDKSIKTKCLTTTITVSTILGSVINGIVAYIAVYFFKPLWEKLVKLFRGRHE